ncbi:hypothetical protein BBK82_08205 [Lentzea guizhouensis]|uniref:Uncharacterized protein n=1 Tax=Lentzea guizhouensis TaxID=1586287 RepID=A0A1B2HEA0_9PSEU|nr:hypothetical protein [Lentzea guizhouensis]ANZ36053.1 hypothetical protein BBK82_08205 [Lentzea guizhouensis]
MKRLSIVVLGVTVVASLAVAPSATAQTSSDLGEPAVVSAVEDQMVLDEATAAAELAVTESGTTQADAVVVSPTGDTTARTDNGSVVQVPADPTQDVTLTAPNGQSVDVGVPGAADAAQAVVVDGTTVYADAAPQTDVVVKPTTEGVQALVTIDGPAAPTGFDFPVTVPAGGQIALGEDGGAVVFDATGSPVATVATPWARDANGNSVPTRFVLEGSTLRQIVEHHQTTAYPVVADPAWFVVWGARLIINVLVGQATKWWYERNGYNCTTYGPWWWHMVACAKPVR